MPAKESMNRNTSTITNIKRVLAPLARIAPRIRPRLHPLHDIRENHSGNTGSWNSIGDDPQFLCRVPLFELHSGWYVIKLDIECESVCDIARFYVDLGNGYNEEDSIQIPFHSRKSTKRVVRFDRRTTAIRFDPVSSAGEFSVREFTISPVTFKFAESRMLGKINRHSPLTSGQARVQGSAIAGTRELLKQQAVDDGTSYTSLLIRKYAAIFSAPVDNQSYSEWIEKVESKSNPAWSDVARLEASAKRPLISILMPTFNTDPKLLDETIDSVINQRYTRWQLCIADDGSTSADTVEALKKWQGKDNRISIVFNENGAGIAANTNAALELATGDYCVFLDHDDLLTEYALFEVASRIVQQPQLKFLYSDEDKLDQSGNRTDPHFKPDWNPDLLLSQNYICHLVALKRELIIQVGGCRSGYEGAQDHDLLLRIMAQVTSDQVTHIPKVLYHWRMTEDSTASNADAKSYSTDSGVKAIADHIRQTGRQAIVAPGPYPNTYRVNWALPPIAPLASIIIPTRDGLEILSQCIDSVLQLTDYPNYEIIVVDNESENPETHEYLDKISSQPNIKVLKYIGRFNYSAINNMAVKEAQGSVITMMNNDIEVISRDWLREMVSHALRDEVGCVGAKLLYKNKMVQHAGVILGIGGVAGHAHKYFDSESAGYFSRLQLTQNLSAVTAACLTVEKKIYQQVGGLNETHLKVAFNDVDFCLKVSASGLRNVWTPYATLYHHESISRGHENTPEKQSRFNSEAAYMQRQWGDQLVSDPAYNCNLTLAREDFSLAA